MKQTLTLVSGALFSRVLGFVRDASFAWLLGGSPTADALSAALRLPYMARRLFGEGSLSLALTSACSGEYARCGAGSGLASAVARRLALFTGLALLIMLPGAPWLLAAIAPGLLERPEVLAQAVSLFRVCAPYLFFAMLAAGGMAALHSRECFLLPALAPAAFNLITITFAAIAGLLAGSPFACALWLAAGVLAGGMGQWLLHLPACLAQKREEENATQRPDGKLVHRVLRHVPAGIFGAAMPQMAFLVAAALASFLPGGHLAALFYAERLLEFPLGLLGATAGLLAAPKLARLAQAAKAAQSANKPEFLETAKKAVADTAGAEKAGAEKAGKQEFAAGPDAGTAAYAPLAEETKRALGLSLALNLPATAGLMAVAAPLVSLVFQRGAFDANAAALTSLALCAYAPGLPAYALSRPLLAICHALEDNRAPLMAAASGLTASLIGGGLLLFFSGPALAAAAPPLGVALGLWLYALLLWRRVARRLGKGLLPLRPLFWQVGGSLATFVAASLTVNVCTLMDLPLALTLALAVACGTFVYGLALLCGARSVFTLLHVRFRGKN